MPGDSEFLSGLGGMRRRLNAYDWAAFPQGHPETWPDAVRTALQLMLDSPQPVAMAWGPQLALFYNDAYAELLSHRHPDALTRPFRHVWPELQAILDPLLEQTLAGVPAYLQDKPFQVPRNGEREHAFYLWSLLPLRDGDGKVIGILIPCMEITRQLEAEQRLSLLIEQTAQAIWEADADGRMCLNSPSWCASTGQTPAESMGHGWIDAIHPDDRVNAELQWQEAVAGRHAVDAELRLRSAGGGWRWSNVRAAPLLDPDGGIRKWVGMSLDISARKATEEGLRTREERYRTLFDSMDEGFCIVEMINGPDGKAVDHRFIEINPAFEKLTGMQQAVGRTAREVTPQIEPYWFDLYGKVAETGEPVRFEHRFSANNCWFDVYATRVGGAGSRMVAVLFSDITQRRLAEEALKASELRFRQLTELSPDGILVNVEDRFVYANRAALRLFGADRMEQLIGLTPFDLVEPARHEFVRERTAIVRRSGDALPLVEMRWRRLDGQYVRLQSTAGEMTWEGRPAIQVVLRDTAELRQSQDKLRIMGERLKLAIEGSGEGIWDWNFTDNSYVLAGGLKTVLGHACEELGGSADQWLQRIHPDDLPHVRTAFEACADGDVPVYASEYRIRSSAGNWIWVRARGVVVERDEERKPLVMTGTLTDITARKESDELAWRHANFDALTGLPGRRLFRERMEVEMRRLRRSNDHLALLFVDLDGFKQVNDLYGHDAGDRVLVEASRRICACVHEGDTVARLGGDEFTIILAERVDLDHIEFVCHKILSRLADPFRVGKETAYVSGSIGISLFPHDAVTPEDLLRKADQAMYAAKRAGRNQFGYFTKEMDDRARDRLRMMHELRHALREGQLAVHYQPVVDLVDRRIVKAEALLRWQHPTMGNVNPADFIPMAEESGLIRQIGNWVFRQAAGCCKRCTDRAGAPFQISVNKSPVQFMSRDTDMNWLQYLSEQGMPGSSISVEITEGVLLHASARVTDKLLQYRDAGVQVALDDFGTGYSSMSYLQKFQIDYVKIDQSFVRNINTDVGSRTIAETIIMMSHKLGKKVIAEGIENQEQLDCLTEAGCDFGQGYLFAPALPEEELIRMVARRDAMRMRVH
ncbi:EAL domain-containing protein [Noviherbaspirillum aerium]|uniref:EAL domain-containing protein n=1 Tax=Noviherbaspirillum aerium TaxID=2588497 RepID=UPI00178C6C00|nr:EAL domain-containing protein [Noviherbaspirillum aerium]